MEDAFKSLGPAAATLFVMLFFLRFLISRLDKADAARDEAHKELVEVLMNTIKLNTETLQAVRVRLDPGAR